MKRWIILLTLLLAALRAQAQTTELEQLLIRHGAGDGVTSIFFERTMMQMMSLQAARQGDRELARLLDEIRFIRVIASRTTTRPADETEQLVRSGRQFRLIAEANLDGQQTRIYLRTWRSHENKELVVITREHGEQTVVHLYGAFDLHDVSRLSSIRP